jgi:hypothetical protein
MMDVDLTVSQPGRTCPPHYRYRASALRGAPALEAETLYIVGGLYGNIEALRTLLEMIRAEEGSGPAITLVFNGDFNWFDIAYEDFNEINETVLRHHAIQGNVEAELGSDSFAGCGCNYPPYVDQVTVDYSNQIMLQLRERAQGCGALVRELSALPMYLTVQVGEERIGILHGDAESLAGWGFAVENMEPLDQGLRLRLGCQTSGQITTQEQVKRYLEAADVRAFACTHTCLPFAQDFYMRGRPHLVMNNGSAGMPNFRDLTAGLVTRISASPTTPIGSLYGITLGSVRFDAIRVAYDQRAWLHRFSRNWPAGSAAHNSYWRRMNSGPDYYIAQALRRSFRGDAKWRCSDNGLAGADPWRAMSV